MAAENAAKVRPSLPRRGSGSKEVKAKCITETGRQPLLEAKETRASHAKEAKSDKSERSEVTRETTSEALKSERSEVVRENAREAATPEAVRAPNSPKPYLSLGKEVQNREPREPPLTSVDKSALSPRERNSTRARVDRVRGVGKAPDRHAEKHAKTTSPSLKEALTRQRTVTDQSHASCMSPSSCKSADSAVDYHQPDQTIIILDWDDTLCPSTTCVWEQGLEPCGPEPTGEVAFALRKHSVAALALLREAQSLADRVVIITNADDGWVETSCGAWMPALLPALDDCEVISARSSFEPLGVTSPAGWKERAFSDAINRFYSRYRHQSWKNVISVGDALYEREALSRVMGWTPRTGGVKCRAKSVKLMERPSIEQLTEELRFLRQGLREIIEHNGNLDVQFCKETAGSN